MIGRVNMINQELREKIVEECKSYKGNYEDIQVLLEYEADAFAASHDTYEFERCPYSYDCLEDSKELCEVEKVGSDNLCERCWKKALGED